MALEYCKDCIRIKNDIVEIYGGKEVVLCDYLNEDKNSIGIVEFDGEFMSETIFNAEKKRNCESRKVNKNLDLLIVE